MSEREQIQPNPLGISEKDLVQLQSLPIDALIVTFMNATNTDGPASEALAHVLGAELARRLPVKAPIEERGRAVKRLAQIVERALVIDDAVAASEAGGVS